MKNDTKVDVIISFVEIVVLLCIAAAAVSLIIICIEGTNPKTFYCVTNDLDQIEVKAYDQLEAYNRFSVFAEKVKGKNMRCTEE